MLTPLNKPHLIRHPSRPTPPEPKEALDQVILSGQEPEPEKLPDLTPTRLTLNNPAPRVGDAVTMWLTVANRGQADADRFRVTVRDGIGYTASANFSGVPKGRSKKVFVGTLMAGRSPWTLTATVDSGNQVKESNERNNVGAKTVITWDR